MAKLTGLMLVVACIAAATGPTQAEERQRSTVWIGNHNDLGVSFSQGGYSGGHWNSGWNSGWSPGWSIGWNSGSNSHWGPWRDPFYRDPFYRDPFWRQNDNWYWQQREWERERQRERQRQAERKRRLYEPQVINPKATPPKQVTQSQEQASGLASLPDNAKVVMVNGKPRYEWQGKRYRLDWETQRYVLDTAKDDHEKPPASTK